MYAQPIHTVTVRTIDLDEHTRLHIIFSLDFGFGYCLSGEANGLAWESQDEFGFASAEEAEAAGREYFRMTSEPDVYI